jgi:hypothetical protein
MVEANYVLFNLVKFYFCCKTTSGINLEIGSKSVLCQKQLVVSILKLLVYLVTAENYKWYQS